MLPYAAFADIGLDNLSAAFLQDHVLSRFGVHVEKAALLKDRLSILQLAYGIASARETVQPMSNEELRRANLDSQEIEHKLLAILESKDPSFPKLHPLAC